MRQTVRFYKQIQVEWSIHLLRCDV